MLEHQSRFGPLAKPLEERLTHLEQEDVARRIWHRDHTLWKPVPTEISDRLGWLTIHKEMQGEAEVLCYFAEDCANFDWIVLLGMGGSSLGPEVLAKTFQRSNFLVLDSTHPVEIAAIDQRIELDRTLFIVASKSGATIETTSQFAYFYEKVQDGRQFVAITDAGTQLEVSARSMSFRRIFLNPPDIGGRYSVLSYFGLVPAALIGVDLTALLVSAEEMASACGPESGASGNPGLGLGALLGEAALHGRDKLTLLLPDNVASFGDWVEQLIAESTGKEGKGIVPVVDEPLGPYNVYGNDRLFISQGVGTELMPSAQLLPVKPEHLGSEFFRWEFATAVAGHILGINPFDQPDVEEAKEAARNFLGAEGTPQPYTKPNMILDTVKPGDYVAIQAYLPRNDDNLLRLQSIRTRIRDRLKVATTLGFGPRYLHSTGQLHKGGPPTGVFIQVVDEPEFDVSIPGKPYTFRKLLDAQAAGDFAALRGRGRQVVRVPLSDLEGVI